MTLRGPDIASYQQGLNLLTLPDADFYLVKATEGASYVDPFYTPWRIQATSSGKPFVWYHFVTVADSAAAQAVNMLNHVGDVSLPGMLDVETEAGKSPSLALVTNVIDEAHARGLRIKLVYLPKWYWQQYWGSVDLKPLRDRGVSLIASNYPGASGTGLAQYEADGGDGGVGWNPYGGCTPAMWQYTDAANAQGQKLDYNAFRGTAADLAALLGEPAPADAATATTGAHRTLTLGTGGEDVRAVQTLLGALGFTPQGIDGQYGQHTQAAVAHAQAAWNITKDGITGPQTYAAIHAHLHQLPYPGLRTIGSFGPAVAQIQSMLWLLGFDPAGIDGVYGQHTLSAVERFQLARDIAKDGITGPDTWAHLTAAA